MATKAKWVGQRMKRKEDPRLIQGLAHYVDDLALPGQLYAAFLRSPYAHARLQRIDRSAAERAPGVVAVLVGEDVRGVLGMIPTASALPELKVPPHPPLAIEEVNHVGEPVAVVVADDRYRARDAVDLIEVDYEPLPAVTDPEKALEKNSPRVHAQFKDNQACLWKVEAGFPDKAFAKAAHVVRQRFVNQRLIPVAMEPRGVLASYDAGAEQLTVWSSTQIPHLLRTQLAAMLNVPEMRVRVIAPEVGGGFGSKLNVYGEEALIAHLAMKLGRPVKWIETRRENFLATIHGRDQINDVEAAVTKDGRILALKVRLTADLGAYHQLLTAVIPTLTGLLLLGCYKIPAVKIEYVGVFTNKMATDAYRGAGRPEATFLIERMVDLVALDLGIDPVEVRRKNFPRPKDFPYSTPTGVIYDSGNYEATLKKALEQVDYTKLREEQKRLWKQGRYLGIGLSTYVEICAMGPSSAMPAGGWESGTVRIEPTGKVTVLTGASPHGQGQETSFAQIVADELGISPEDVIVTHGDTQAVPYGIGTFGSRATAVGGTAMFLSLQKLKQKLARMAGHLLKVDPKRIEIGEGKLFVKGSPKKSKTFLEVVQAAYMAKTLPAGFEPGLEATTFFEPSNFTFPFGAHVCVVEVDAETGDVHIRRYVAVDDCGNVINPLLVDGQVHGGIVQSIGQALFEEAVYDENGQLVTGELMDYAIPRAADVPRLETARTVTPSPVNPMGVKGVGEAGTIAATPAVVNAVVDALRPLGVRDIPMPLKRERIWEILQAGKRA
ncbi:MAG: carbon monoxide dehydrogenase [Acidobacteria bacterium RIFCSPHIGHO2_12_FULL_67_30]|nr:MAG: carbon monoxide dehydrogenase [Acidobacteria bacterium RIFCSPHIGHO2_02_FULL_67_57]OFV87373.1 MAG: carbon monoxide dehydrogenase [Acidobacteria bacterium RIFCSPHIGHO2_12_FULL_67_30]